MLQLRTGLLRFERLPCFGYPFVLASLLHLGLRDLPKGWPAPRHQACASRGGSSATASGEPAAGPSASLTARASSRTRNAATLISWARVLVPEASPSIPSLRTSSSVRSATASSRLATRRANSSCFMLVASRRGLSSLGHPLGEQPLGLLDHLLLHPAQELSELVVLSEPSAPRCGPVPFGPGKEGVERLLSVVARFVCHCLTHLDRVAFVRRGGIVCEEHIAGVKRRLQDGYILVAVVNCLTREHLYPAPRHVDIVVGYQTVVLGSIRSRRGTWPCTIMPYVRFADTFWALGRLEGTRKTLSHEARGRRIEDLHVKAST